MSTKAAQALIRWVVRRSEGQPWVHLGDYWDEAYWEWHIQPAYQDALAAEARRLGASVEVAPLEFYQEQQGTLRFGFTGIEPDSLRYSAEAYGSENGEFRVTMPLVPVHWRLQHALEKAWVFHDRSRVTQDYSHDFISKRSRGELMRTRIARIRSLVGLADRVVRESDEKPPVDIDRTETQRAKATYRAYFGGQVITISPIRVTSEGRYEFEVNGPGLSPEGTGISSVALPEAPLSSVPLSGVAQTSTMGLVADALMSMVSG